MKAIGFLLLLIAAIAFLVGFTMDTTVAADLGGRRIHNIGLMNDRQNTFIFAGVLAVIGAMFVGFTRAHDPLPENAVDNILFRTCPYCAETVKTAASICRFCQKDLSPVVKPSVRVSKPHHIFSSNKWSCGVCDEVNESDKKMCGVCGSALI